MSTDKKAGLAALLFTWVIVCLLLVLIDEVFGNIYAMTLYEIFNTVTYGKLLSYTILILRILEAAVASLRDFIKEWRRL